MKIGIVGCVVITIVNSVTNLKVMIMYVIPKL